MDKKTYFLLRVLDGCRIVLGDKRAFGKDDEFYKQLYTELKEDWTQAQRPSLASKDEKTEFVVGEHVLANSTAWKGPGRAIVMEVNECTTSLQERSYSLFFYDEGKLEDLCESEITALKNARKMQVEPRSLIVRLPGIVPAKIVPDLATMSPNMDGDVDANAKADVILTQDSSWSKKSSRLVKEWLKDDAIKHLRVVTTKSNTDGSIYGDIFRKLKNQPESAETKANKYQHLGQYIVTKTIGLYNAQLAESQLKIRTPPSKKTSYKDEVDEEKPAEKGVVNVSKSAASAPQMNQDPVSPLKATGMSEGKKDSSPKSVSASSDGEKRDLEHDMDIQFLGYGTPSAPSQNQTDMMMYSNKEHDNDIPGRLLVRGRFMRKPYTNLEQFQLHKNILKALDVLQIGELSSMHKVVAPNFIRGSDQIVIAPDGIGRLGKNMRALSYLLPLLRIVYDKCKETTRFDETQAPETLIICNSYNTGADLEIFINQLLNYDRDLPMRVKFLHKDIDIDLHSRSSKHYKKRMVPGGISILIMTMSYLGAVMDTNEGSFLFKQLKFLVFEEADLYLRSHKDAILTFLSATFSLNLQVSYDSLPFQITFSGSKWCEEMENLYKEVVKDRAPMVTISASNQVVHYAKIECVVHHVKEEEKRLQNLTDLLKEKCLEAHTRIIIACNDPSIAKSVYESLKSKCLAGTQVSLASSKSNVHTLTDIRSLWKKKSINVLVVSDDVMQDVAITDATCLVCFDSPKLQVHGGVSAVERFSYLWANIRHVEMEHRVLELEVPPPVNLVAHFLMTGKEHNFYEMYKFGKSLGGIVQFPSELQQRVSMIEQIGQQTSEMCPGFKLFGFCNHADPESCEARHFFSKSELSATPSVPLTGEVEVRIIKCENPSSYKAELMRHFEYVNGKRVCNRSYINDARRRTMELEKYYGNVKHKIKQVNSVKEEDWCAVKVVDPNSVYYVRAKIEKILRKDKLNQPMTVRVYCIDSGVILNPSIDQLYELPKEFREWNPLVVNLILCNLKAGQDEMEYRRLNVKKAKEITNDKIFNAKIWLSIGNTIWVNPMVEYHVDPTTRKAYRGDSVRMTLMNDRIAVFNAGHLDVLMEEVNKHPGIYQGITCPSEKNSMDSSSDELLEAKQEFHQIGDEIRWAFLGKSRENKFDPAKIVTQFGDNPWLFFGVHDKHYDQLKVLEKELHECITKYTDGNEEDLRFTNFNDIFKNYYEVGMVIAAKERGDQTWMRGLIMQIHDVRECDDEKKNGMEFEIFFVDYGDTCNLTVDELFPIPHKFVTRLPFQVIAFKLDHIQPPAGREIWSKDEKDAFLDIVLANEKSIDLELVAYGEVDDESLTPVPCRYYNTVAFYKEDELGSLLVKMGAAEWNPGKEDMVKTVKDNLLNFYNVSVDQTLAAEDEEEDEQQQGPFAINEFELSEEFDMNIETSEIQDILEITKIGFKGPDTSVGSPTSENRNATEMQAISASDVVPSSSSSASTIPTIVSKPVKNKEIHLPQSKTAPFPSNDSKDDGLLRPKVLWRQTKTSFTLTIQLPDIKEYELCVMADATTIQFKTLDKSPNYGFEMKVYGRVQSDYSAFLTGRYVRVTFIKKMETMWLRPLYSKTENYKWLVGDLDHVDDEEEDDMASETIGKNEFERLQRTVQDGDKGNDECGDLEEFFSSDDDDDTGEDEEEN